MINLKYVTRIYGWFAFKWHALFLFWMIINWWKWPLKYPPKFHSCQLFSGQRRDIEIGFSPLYQSLLPPVLTLIHIIVKGIDHALFNKIRITIMSVIPAYKVPNSLSPDIIVVGISFKKSIVAHKLAFPIN